MPITYHIDSVTSTIETRLTGAITTEEVREHFERLADDPATPDRLWVLIDAMELGTIPTMAMLEMTRRMAAFTRARVRYEAVAVAAGSAAHYGMFRMGQVLLESVFGATHVCRTLPEAREWLAQQRDGRSGTARKRRSV